MSDDELTSRLARPDDYRHFARLSQELGSDAPRHSADAWTAELMPTTLVFEDGALVVGYAFVQPLERTGYVRHVVLAPTHRGRGLGLVVMRAAARFLATCGCVDWCLNVRPENTPAVRLYERSGMTAEYASRSLSMPWTIVDELPREESVVPGRELEPSDDQAVEATFALPRGQLANARARAGRRLVGLQQRDTPGAWAAAAGFDPWFPGAFLFRVQRVTLAAPLLEAFRPFALPEHTHLRVMVEDHEELSALLLRHGAETKFTILHMAGPLP